MRKTIVDAAPTSSAPIGVTSPPRVPNSVSSERPNRSISLENANEWNNAASIVQLANSTQKKPIQSLIVPGPRKPPPFGNNDFATRQRRGKNQTAEAPNQPKTTMCMLGTNERY